MKEIKTIPENLLTKINPLLNPGEKILLTFKEPFRIRELQRRWLALTELRLVIIYITPTGSISIDEIHLRDLDIEFIMTKFGLFDEIILRNRNRVLYSTGSSRSRRSEVRAFIRAATNAITKREIAFRQNLGKNVENSCDSISTLKGLNTLRQTGGISEEEYKAKKEELLRKI